MSIATKLQSILNSKANIKSAIQSINPKCTTDVLAEFPEYIISNAQNDNYIPNNDFIFIDFRGIVLYSYSKAEIDAMTELPALNDLPNWKVPLTAQGWNYTLAELQSIDRAVVGGLYTPTDNKLHVFARCNARDKQAAAAAIRVGYRHTASAHNYYWYQDGELLTSGTLTDATGYLYNNNVTAGAENHIVFEQIVDGETFSFGHSSYYGFVGSQYQRQIYEIYAPDWFKISSSTAYLFSYTSLNYISLSSGMTCDTACTHNYLFFDSLIKTLVFPRCFTTLSGAYVIEGCENLRFVSLPPTLTGSTGNYFISTSNVRHVVIPEGVTTIGNYFMYNNRTAETITLPSTLTSVGNYCLGQGTPILRDVYCYATTPPTSGTAAVAISNNDFKVHVPADSLSAYQSATNWTSWSTYMTGDL